MTEKQAPGVMLYFELAPCLECMSDEQCGALFKALMRYAMDGTEMETQDVAVKVAWLFLKPRIDADREAYSRRVEKASAAVKSRWARTKEEQDPILEDTDVYERIPEYSDAILGIPTTTTTSTTTTTPSTTTTPTITATPSSTPTSTTSFSSNIFLKTPEPNGSGEKEKIFLKEKKNNFSSEENDVSFKPPTLREVEEYVRERQSPVDPRVFYDFYQSKGWRVGQTPMTDWRASLRAAESWSRWKKPPAAPTRQQTPTRPQSPTRQQTPARAQPPYSQDDPHVNHVTQEELSDLRAMIEKIKRGGENSG